MEDPSLTPTAPSATPTTPATTSLRPTRLGSGLLAGGATFAMVMAGLGIAAAQTDDSSPDPSTTAPPAAAAPAPEGEGVRPHGPGPGRHHLHGAITIASQVLGVSVDDLRTQLQDGKSLATIAGDKTQALIDALVADGNLHLQDAVTHGRLTQAEADERKAGLPEKVTELVNATPPAGLRVDGDDEGRPEGGPGVPGMRGDHGPRADLSVASSVLGISPDELRTQLQSGKSLATIAGDKTPALIDALVAAGNTRLDQAVTDGRLTQAQADERKAHLTERITDLVNRTPGEGGPRGHHGPPPGDDDGPAPAPAEAAPASVTA